MYQSATHSTPGVVLCVLFLKRELTIHSHLLKPDVEDHVMSQQAAQKSQHDQHSRATTMCGTKGDN